MAQILPTRWSMFGLAFALAATLFVSRSQAQMVKSSIHKMSGWQSCTVCAGANASGTKAVYWMAQYQNSPSISGASAKFFLGGSTPYSDALWWKQLGANNSATHFVYDLYFYLQTPQSSQALEFDANQSNSSKKFIFGTQCNLKGGSVWEVWDARYGAWRSTGIPCYAPTAYKWHHLTWEFHRDSGMTHFISFTLDGVKHYVNRAYYAIPMGAQEINVAFQMDGNYAQQDYAAWLDNVQPEVLVVPSPTTSFHPPGSGTTAPAQPGHAASKQ